MDPCILHMSFQEYFIVNEDYKYAIPNTNMMISYLSIRSSNEFILTAYWFYIVDFS